MNAHTPHVFSSPNPDEYWTDERIYVREIMNTPEEPEMSLALCRVPAGVTTQRHSLSTTEWYIIINGFGVVEINGQKTTMEAGDCVRIAPQQHQCIHNSGTTDLVFKSLCRPRFTPDTYTNLEEQK